MNNSSKAYNKKKYYKGQKRFKQSVLDVNMKGFLCSCSTREKDCLREALVLLERYADKNNANTLDLPTENEQIEDELSNEVASLKKNTDRFQPLDSGAKNILFIRTLTEDPNALTASIISDISTTRKQQTRFLVRVVPIETTCKAYLKDIEKAFEPLLDKYFKEEPQVFSIIFNHRSNNNLSRTEVIEMLAKKIMETRPDHKVNLKEPKMSVVVEVIKGIALLSVIPNFLKYKKYNLLTLCDDEKNVHKSIGEDVS